MPFSEVFLFNIIFFDPSLLSLSLVSCENKSPIFTHNRSDMNTDFMSMIHCSNRWQIELTPKSLLCATFFAKLFTQCNRCPFYQPTPPTTPLPPQSVLVPIGILKLKTQEETFEIQWRYKPSTNESIWFGLVEWRKSHAIIVQFIWLKIFYILMRVFKLHKHYIYLTVYV